MCLFTSHSVKSKNSTSYKRSPAGDHIPSHNFFFNDLKKFCVTRVNQIRGKNYNEHNYFSIKYEKIKITTNLNRVFCAIICSVKNLFFMKCMEKLPLPSFD